MRPASERVRGGVSGRGVSTSDQEGRGGRGGQERGGKGGQEKRRRRGGRANGSDGRRRGRYAGHVGYAGYVEDGLAAAGATCVYEVGSCISRIETRRDARLTTTPRQSSQPARRILQRCSSCHIRLHAGYRRSLQRCSSCHGVARVSDWRQSGRAGASGERECERTPTAGAVPPTPPGRLRATWKAISHRSPTSVSALATALLALASHPSSSRPVQPPVASGSRSSRPPSPPRADAPHAPCYIDCFGAHLLHVA